METETVVVITDEQLDSAEAEARAQHSIIKTLKYLRPERRQTVLIGAYHLIEADALVPGVLDRFLHMRKRPEDNGASA